MAVDAAALQIECDGCRRSQFTGVLALLDGGIIEALERATAQGWSLWVTRDHAVVDLGPCCSKKKAPPSEGRLEL